MRISNGLLVATLLAATPVPSLACSCVEVGVRKSYRQADVVFAGTLVGKTQVGGLVRYTFRVKHLYKGSAQTDTLSVRSSGSSATCGSSFDLNTDYLIYSWFRDTKSESTSELEPKASPILYTGLCTRNKPERFSTLFEKAFLAFL